MWQQGVASNKQKGIDMNESVKKWINGKADRATFTIDKVATGHKQHQAGCGVHDNRPKRERTRSAKFRTILRSYD